MAATVIDHPSEAVASASESSSQTGYYSRIVNVHPNMPYTWALGIICYLPPMNAGNPSAIYMVQLGQEAKVCPSHRQTNAVDEL